MKLEEYQGWKYGYDGRRRMFELQHDKQVKDPLSFFKYYALTDNSVDALTNLYVYASHPAQLNDPFDCDDSLAIIDDEVNAKFVWDPLYEKVRLTYPKNEDFYRYTTKAFSTVMFSKWGVLSLTDRSDSMIMWSLYAQNNGFCLEWDVSQFPFDKSGPYPIHYVSKIEEATSSKYDAATLVFIQSNVKNKCWSYENEWRLMIHAPLGFDMKMFGKFAEEINKSYPDAHDRKFRYPLSSLKSITLGVNFFKDLSENRRAVLTKNNELHVCYPSICNQTKVLDFLDKLNSQYCSTRIQLAHKERFELTTSPICVKKLSDLAYCIIELPE